MASEKKTEDLKEFKAEIESSKRAKEASLDLEKQINSLRNDLSSKELEADILIAKQLKLKWVALILTAFIIIFVVQTKHFAPASIIEEPDMPILIPDAPDLEVGGG